MRGGDRRCGRIAVSMVDSTGSAPTSRRRHIVRLAVFAGFLLALFYLLACETSCYRYWGQGIWTDYGAELARRACETASSAA